MTKEEAKLVLLCHIRQCGAMMPIAWVRSHGEGSETMEAFRMAMDALSEGEEDAVK